MSTKHHFHHIEYNLTGDFKDQCVRDYDSEEKSKQMEKKILQSKYGKMTFAQLSRNKPSQQYDTQK